MVRGVRAQGWTARRETCWAYWPRRSWVSRRRLRECGSWHLLTFQSVRPFAPTAVQVGYLLPAQRIALAFHGSEVVLQVAPSAESISPPQNDVPSDVLSVGRATDVSIRSHRPVAPGGEVRRSKDASSKPTSTAPSSSARRLGGLDAEVKQLREMIFLPLMRPELFREHGE